MRERLLSRSRNCHTSFLEKYCLCGKIVSLTGSLTSKSEFHMHTSALYQRDDVVK